MSFGFDPSAPMGHRVDRNLVRVNNQPLDVDRTYKMATKAYVARGRDGYSCLRDCPLLNDPDSGPILSTVVRNHIMNVNKLMEFEEQENCKVCDVIMTVL